MFEIILDLASVFPIPEGLKALLILVTVVAMAGAAKLALKLRRRPRIAWIGIIALTTAQIGFFLGVYKSFRHDFFADFDKITLAYPLWNCTDAAEYRVGGRMHNQFTIEDFRRMQQRPTCQKAVSATEWLYLTLSFFQTFALSLCLWTALFLARSEKEWTDAEGALKSGIRWARAIFLIGQLKQQTDQKAVETLDPPKAPRRASRRKRS